MSYKEEMYTANQEAGHQFSCAYAAGGDCACLGPPEFDEEPTSPEAEEFNYNSPQQLNKNTVAKEKPCCNNPNCGGFPDLNCDINYDIPF